MKPLIFLDIETTGLDPHYHEIWQVAAIIFNEDHVNKFNIHVKPLNLERANKKALEISQFKERFDSRAAIHPSIAAEKVHHLTKEGILLGLNISFDINFLSQLFEKNSLKPEWYYSSVDVKSLMAGYLGMSPPWSSETLAEAIGINPQNYRRHDALADCQYTADCYFKTMELAKKN